MFIQIKLWSVQPQIKEAQSAPRIFYKITNFRETMNGVVFQDQEYHLLNSCLKSLEKCNKNRECYIALSTYEEH
jgi:hypothetical protein